MNRDEAKKVVPIIQAYGDGKIIQYNDRIEGWIDVSEPFFIDGCEYRIKPEPKYVPFTIDDSELFIGKWIHITHQVQNHFALIVSFDVDGIGIDMNSFTYESAFQYTKFKDGSPFGKLTN